MSSPATASPSAAATSAKPARKYYMDPALVRARVGLGVKPTNPLLQFIPECKTIDEFNAFTKTDTYRKLMDFRNPMVEVKMDPEYRKFYDKAQNTRARFASVNDYPIYAKLPAQRFWYRTTWALVFLSTIYSLDRIFFVIKEH
ncbi:hypothetical protein U1Q18_050555 [Sarracenia purpurea var. burkii]